MWRSASNFCAGVLVVASLAVPPVQAGDEDLFIRPEDQRNVLFAGVDVGRSVFVSGGSKQTLVGSLDRPGFLVLESAGFGLTREVYRGAVELPALRLTTQSSVVTGYQWLVPGLYVAALVGPELEHEQLTVGGEIYRLSQPRLGARGQVEIWSNPTSSTLLTGTVVASSTRGSVWARGSAGYALWRGLFVGPEVTTYATDTYREVKAGLHVTGFSLGIVQGRVSAGWMMTDDGHAGSPYVGISAWIRM